MRLSWDHFIAISRFTAKRLTAYRVSAASITVIPCGVDTKEIDDVKAGPRRLVRSAWWRVWCAASSPSSSSRPWRWLRDPIQGYFKTYN